MSEDTKRKFKLKAKASKTTEVKADSKKELGRKVSRDLQKYDISSFNTIIEHSKALSNLEYAVERHGHLFEMTKLIKGERSSYSLHDVNELLVKYPGNYGWALIEHEILRAELEAMTDEFDGLQKSWYGDAEISMDEKKPTVKAIEAHMYMIHKDDIDEWKNNIRQMTSKVNIASGMVKVWSNTINSIQSLSKNLTTEIEAAKAKMR